MKLLSKNDFKFKIPLNFFYHLKYCSLVLQLLIFFSIPFPFPYTFIPLIYFIRILYLKAFSSIIYYFLYDQIYSNSLLLYVIRNALKLIIYCNVMKSFLLMVNFKFLISLFSLLDASLEVLFTQYEFSFDFFTLWNSFNLFHILFEYNT